MTNYEDNKDILVKLTVLWKSWGVDRESGKIRPCDEIQCYKCELCNGGKTCQEMREKWLDEECVDPDNINWDTDIDWDSVPVDTPVVVWNNDGECIKGYFYKKDDYYFVFAGGQTSYTSKARLSIGYYHCKLANLEDIKKYRK